SQYDWDLTGVADSPDWRLRISASDGMATTVATSDKFIVSHATTTDTYDSIEALAGHRPRCSARGQTLSGWWFCHNQNFGPTGGGPFFGMKGDPTFVQYRGIAWRKVIQTREMPPKSYQTFPDFSACYDGAPLTEDERSRIGQWLLAGAPQ